MKKQKKITIIIFFIIILLSILFALLFFNTKKYNTQSPITFFEYSWGGGLGPYYVYKIELDNNRYNYYVHASPNPYESTNIIDSSCLRELNDIIIRHNVTNWNGFDGYEMGVMDRNELYPYYK